MAEPAVLQATFADWRTVKGRKQLQLIFEVPIEQQAHVLSVLGAPLSDTATWVAIARLMASPAPRESAPNYPEIPGSSPKPKNLAASERGKALYASKDDMAKAVTRAVLLCKDAQFQKWCLATDEITATATLKRFLAISSRNEIGTDEVVYRGFLRVEMDYRESTHGLPEIRG